MHTDVRVLSLSQQLLGFIISHITFLSSLYLRLIQRLHYHYLQFCQSLCLLQSLNLLLPCKGALIGVFQSMDLFCKVLAFIKISGIIYCPTDLIEEQMTLLASPLHINTMFGKTIAEALELLQDSPKENVRQNYSIAML